MKKMGLHVRKIGMRKLCKFSVQCKSLAKHVITLKQHGYSPMDIELCDEHAQNILELLHESLYGVPFVAPEEQTEAEDNGQELEEAQAAIEELNATIKDFKLDLEEVTYIQEKQTKFIEMILDDDQKKVTRKMMENLFKEEDIFYDGEKKIFDMVGFYLNYEKPGEKEVDELMQMYEDMAEEKGVDLGGEGQKLENTDNNDTESE